MDGIAEMMILSVTPCPDEIWMKLRIHSGFW